MASKVDFEQKLRERAAVIANTVISQQAFYSSSDCSHNQRQLLETMVGAALWYLPQSNKMWTGCISVGAVKEFIASDEPKSVKLTKDHHYPRKVSAAELFAVDWQHIDDPVTEVYDRYVEKYGQYNYVLPLENKQLVKYQKTGTFVSPQESYRQAGIKLAFLTEHQLKDLRTGDKSLASDLLASCAP